MGDYHSFLPLIIVVGAFAANVLAQVLLSRYSRISLLSTIFLCFFGGIFLLVALHLLLLPMPLLEQAAALVLNLLIYGSLGYGYFHFVNLGETARRIRILREFDIAGGSLTLTELKARYNASTILEVRLSRLLRKKQLREEGGNLFIALPQVLWMSQALVGLKRVYLKRALSSMHSNLKTPLSDFSSK